MALTFTKIMAVPGMGDKKMSVYKIKGDGSTTEIPATKIGLNRVNASLLYNIDDTGGGVLSTYSGTTLDMDTAIDSGKYQIIFAWGY